MAFAGILADDGIRISMDGRGRWMDNALIRSSSDYGARSSMRISTLKAPPRAATPMPAPLRGSRFYNAVRPHQALANRTAMEVCTKAWPLLWRWT